MKKFIENKRGITLIALVITIVVLIILAGISINFVLGENGIINKAIEASSKQNISRIQENLELLKAPILIDEHTVSLDNYLVRLEEKSEEYKVDYIDRVDSNNAYIVLEGKYKFLLKDTENGDVEIIYEGDVGELLISETSGEYEYPEIKTFIVTKNESGGVLSVSSSNENIAKASISGNVVTVESGLTAGIAVITLKSEKTEEYEENKVKYIAIVENGEIEVTETTYNGTYDGEEHGVTITTNPSDATILYSVDELNFSETNPTFTDVGTYTVYYEVSKEGYKTKTGSITVTIIDETEPNSASFVLTGNTTQATLPIALTAQVTLSDSQSGVNAKNSKWILNSESDEIGTNPANYTGGEFESEEDTLNLSISSAGTYYLHVLTMDNSGNAKETIKGPIKVIGNTHSHVSSCNSSSTCGVTVYRNGSRTKDFYCANCQKTRSVSAAVYYRKT